MKKLLIGLLALGSINAFSQKKLITYRNSTYPAQSLEISCYSEKCDFLVLESFDEKGISTTKKILNKEIFVC